MQAPIKMQESKKSSHNLIPKRKPDEITKQERSDFISSVTEKLKVRELLDVKPHITVIERQFENKEEVSNANVEVDN